MPIIYTFNRLNCQDLVHNMSYITSLNCCVKLIGLALLQFNVIGIDLYPIFYFSQTLNMSNCQNVSHVGLSSLTYGAEYLQHLFLAYSLSVSP